MGKGKSMKRVLILCAHPDDEALGCGGTIYKHSSAGDLVKLIVMTNGEDARAVVNEEREDYLKKSCKILGIESVHSFNFPDNKMDSVPLLDIIQEIEEDCLNFDPHIVYTHALQDLNIDHQITHQVAMTIFRPLPNTSLESIFTFEVPSSTEWASHSSRLEFSPNHFINIEESYDKKMEALKAYDAEMRDYPHSRSYEYVEALCTVRGAQVGLKKAESFFCERSICR